MEKRIHKYLLLNINIIHSFTTQLGDHYSNTQMPPKMDRFYRFISILTKKRNKSI